MQEKNFKEIARIDRLIRRIGIEKTIKIICDEYYV